MRRSPSYPLSLLALLLAFCLGLSALESFLLPLFSIPIPGVKLGISNLVILFCIGQKRPLFATALVITRSLLTAFLFGGPTSFFFSLSGGLVSLLVMCLARPLIEHGFSFVAVSVLGSLGFQFGQGIFSVLLYGDAILLYLPVLFFCGIFTGFVLGIVENLIFDRISKYFPQ